jgi:cytochrome c-type biogenesis protein CcmH/NrfG
MAELLLLLFVLAAAGLAIAWPLLDRQPSLPAPADDGEREALRVRHRLALEALRDIEADWRAGSLDEAAYLAQRAEAEATAAQTLDVAGPAAVATERRPVGSGRGTAITLGIGVLALVLLGFALPAPMGIGERTVTNQALADAVAAEDARQATIARLLDQLQADPRNTDVLSQLADAYLAGASTSDQQRGAVALLALLTIDPEDASAYRRLITAYMNAGDWTDARSAVDSYEKVAAADEPDIPFFRGLLALRADDDPAEAVKQFDRFLELAPDDGRVPMVTTLREQASAQAGGT